MRMGCFQKIAFAVMVFALTEFSFFHTSANGSEPQVFWGISFVGGGSPFTTHKDFYLAGKHLHQAFDSFGIHGSDRFEFFGQDRETACYREFGSEFEKRYDAAIRAFLNSNGDCTKAAPIFSWFKNSVSPRTVCQTPKFTVSVYRGVGDVDETHDADSVKELLDLDGDGKSDFRGPADAEALMTALDEIAARAKANDHLYVGLTGHGSYAELVGGGNSRVYASLLSEKLNALAQAGVIIHADVLACKSGSFIDRLTRSDLDGAICGSASARADVIAVDGSPYDFPDSYSENFAKYGSQLKAFACSLASDTSNAPYSSLDKVIVAWETKQTPEFLSHLSVEVGRSAETDEGQLRQQLIASYREIFVKTLKDCRGADTEFDERLNESMKKHAELLKCLDDPTFRYSQRDRESWRSFFKIREGDQGSNYPVQMMDRHLRFLRHADSGSLGEFKKAYCCLSFDFKQRTMPDLCKSTKSPF